MLRAIGVAYVVSVVASEALTVFVDAAVGLVCHAVVILLLLGFALVAGRQEEGRASSDRALNPLQVLPALALVPLARILSLTMPVPDLPPIYWYAVTGAPLLLAIILTARLFGAAWTRETFRFEWTRTQALIAVSGVPLGLLAYAALRPQRLEPHLTKNLVIAGFLVLPVFTGLTEELLFRGILQRVFTDLFGAVGWIAAAGLFTAMYLGTKSGPYIAVVALVGLFFGWCVRVTRSLGGVVTAHAFISIGLVLVWPYVLG